MAAKASIVAEATVLHLACTLARYWTSTRNRRDVACVNPSQENDPLPTMNPSALFQGPIALTEQSGRPPATLGV